MASHLENNRLDLPEPTPCANCGILASKSCVGCIGSPEYESGEPVGIVYCSRDCQTAHWPNHKAQCIVMGKGKKLLRIATLLKATLLTYRECVFDLDIERIDFQEGVLRLRGSTRNRPGHIRFPDHLTTNVEYKQAALTNNQCTLAMALLGPLARQLLAGISSSITSSDLSIGKPVFSTKLVSGLHSPPSYVPPHTVLIVKLKTSEEKWIIDVASAQFGFQDVLIPFDKYFRDEECKDLEGSKPYNANETKDIDYFSTFPFMTGTAQHRKKLAEDRASRLHFAAFVRAHIQDGGISFNKNLFSGSASDFNTKLDIFIGDLKVHMMEFVRDQGH